MQMCFGVLFQTGRTFLMVACDKGDVSIVRELLEVEIDPNAVDSVGDSSQDTFSHDAFMIRFMQ